MEIRRCGERLRLSCGVGLLVLVATAAGAEIATIDLLVDVDRNASTGCEVTTAEGTAPGIERRLRARYDASLGEVVEVSAATCEDGPAGLFGIDVPVATAPSVPWAGATGDGLAGSTSIEAHWPLAGLMAPGLVRVHVAIESALGQDAAHGTQVGQPLLVALGAPNVPGLTGVAALLALVLSSVVALGRSAPATDCRRATVGIVAGAGLLLAFLAPQAGRALLADGVWRSWAAEERVVIDPAGDAALGIDLRALWVFADQASGELWVRVDVAFGPGICLDWGRVDPGTGYSCSQSPPADAGPFAGAVALTFDDGPHPVHTPQIVATLRALQIPATFFMNGYQLSTPTQQAIALDIHLDPLFRVANHTVDHPNLTLLEPSEVEYQILETSDRLREAIGDPCHFPEYFRFPYGRADCTTVGIVRSLGHAVTGVHFSPQDWCYGLGGGTCEAAVIPDLPEAFRDDLVGYTVHEFEETDGGILLLHDVHQTTADALPAMIQALIDAGAYFVDLDDPALFPVLGSWIQPPEAPACCQAGP